MNFINRFSFTNRSDIHEGECGECDNKGIIMLESCQDCGVMDVCDKCVYVCGCGSTNYCKNCSSICFDCKSKICSECHPDHTC